MKPAGTSTMSCTPSSNTTSVRSPSTAEMPSTGSPRSCQRPSIEKRTWSPSALSACQIQKRVTPLNCTSRCLVAKSPLPAHGIQLSMSLSTRSPGATARPEPGALRFSTLSSVTVERLRLSRRLIAVTPIGG